MKYTTPTPPPRRPSSLDTTPLFQWRRQPEQQQDWPGVTSLNTDQRAVRGEMLREDAAGCRETLNQNPEAGGG